MKPSDRASRRWADWVGIESRYQRSVHLERDLEASAGLLGYIVTPLVVSILARIAPALETAAATRAWSITGPYGSGKSALALFLSRILGLPSAVGGKQARHLLQQQASESHTQLLTGHSLIDSANGLVPVLATGERIPLEALLLRGLRDAATAYWKGPGIKPTAIKIADRMYRKASGGERVSTREIVTLFEEVSQKVAASNKPGKGLFIVIDEAGKALEFAARNPERSDVHILQELAELANRSGSTPILLCVILHQAFEQYAGHLSAADRTEWAKVQGRFQDIPFQEASDQVLRMVGAALARTGVPPAFSDVAVHHLIDALADIVCEGTGWNTSQVKELLRSTVPLHPVTALALAPLFRGRLAQNERSLFAFLASTEPGGFREFLNAEAPPDEWPLFTLDRFYDYVESAFGNRLHGSDGRLWAQIDLALSRLPTDATALDARLVKAVGLLGSIRDRSGMTASPRILQLAFEDADDTSRTEIRAALERLSKSSVLVYRRYRDAYQLWDGSDLDLDQLVEEALAAVDAETDLANRLGRLAPCRPVVARRHLFQTGTLRYFDVQYADESLINRGLESESAADGVIWLVIPSTVRDRRQVVAGLAQPMTWLSANRASIVGVVRESGRIRSLAREITAMVWVRTNTAELQDDPVARRELEGRIADAQGALQQEVDGIRFGTTPCDWFTCDGAIAVTEPRRLTAAVSDICDRVYSKTPRLHNELLNRAELSSAAARARRQLMTAMIERVAQDRLGIEGAPPELSMYRSLLESSGLHGRSENGEWRLQPPSATKKVRLRAAWDAIQATLRTAEDVRIPATDLINRLKIAPFGMKEGPIPVLLLAILLHDVDELAVYEEGVFVSRLTGAEVERFLRAPERFEIQRFEVVGPREAVLTRLTAAFVPSAPRGSAVTLPVVRHLARFANGLPEFAKNTRAISEQAQAVREALLRAREPGTLLFDALPRAVGCAPITTTPRSKTEVDDFVSRLRNALGELQSSYDQLLENQAAQLQKTFDLPLDRARMREELAARTGRVVALAVDVKLKGFLIRAADRALEEREWLTSIATLLAGKPPAAWRDDDAAIAEMTLGRIRQQFAAIEAMSMATEQRGAQVELLRVSITQSGGQESERVVPLRTKRSKQQGKFRETLKQLLNSASLPRDILLGEIALAAQQLIIQDDDNSGRLSEEDAGGA